MIVLLLLWPFSDSQECKSKNIESSQSVQLQFPRCSSNRMGHEAKYNQMPVLGMSSDVQGPDR